jgi:hypothetical protein
MPPPRINSTPRPQSDESSTISAIRICELAGGALLASWLITHLLTGHLNLGDLGLGDRTQSVQAKDGNFLTHLIKNTDEEEQSLISGWKARGKKPVCLVLGYSQAHSINEMNEGDLTFPKILFDRHKTDNPPLDILCQSLPNANMTEYYALFAYWSSKLRVQSLILPACLDKMRNDDQRPDYLQNLGVSGFQIPDAHDDLTDLINRSLAAFPKRADTPDKQPNSQDHSALTDTVQESVERSINEWLTLHWTGWSRRADARGNVFHFLYLLRNSVLGISSNTKRKVIPAKYNSNMTALENILAMAELRKIRVLVYIPPVRMDIPTPYVDSEYESFKQDVNAAVDRHSTIALFLNIENIVAEPFWGDLPASDLSGIRQPDFMHFKAQGHQLTADALEPFIRDLNRP